MKILRLLLLLMLVAAICLGTLVACNKPDDNNNDNNPPADDPGDKDPWAEYDIITISKALELCGEPGNLTEERYYIRGTITSVDNASYGAMTIEDETGSIYVYGTYSADGSIGYAAMTDKPYKGDEVLLHCTLQNYNGTKEVKNARLIDFKKNEQTVDESQYTEMTIAQARDAEKGAKVKVDGVVARITYANGYIPMGVFLVDETQSIYVYDGDLAQRVQVGNKVTILGSKAYWILESEQNNAEKFGYKGCCQLDEVTLVDLDNGTYEFDKSWIQTSTVKDILETPVTENITSTIYKVNALIKKVDGSGFVNYYINDLDGTTGSYTYSQCNGGDFSWLDEFDGKICTVYLSPLNAKSTSSDCLFRFIPVAVAYENFTFDVTKAAEHAVKYYGVKPIENRYTGNPELELVSSVESELLGFSGATLTYTSSNESVVYFTTKDGKTILNCGDTGTATVTVKGAYNGVEYSETIEITVSENQTYENITIQQAINTPVGETVILKGIVGPSLVNKTGFYLFDSTGMVAVTVDASVFDSVKIGHEIVLQGKRDCFKDVERTHAGQIAISKCTVLANYYGEHDYPTDKFITDKTLKDMYNLNVNEDHSTEVYVVKATVNIVETAFYTSIKLSAEGVDSFTLYCSSAGQYSFLKPYNGKEVTLEIAPCNWNNKSFYAGCVLAVYTEDGKIVNELNFK